MKNLLEGKCAVTSNIPPNGYETRVASNTQKMPVRVKGFLPDLTFFEMCGFLKDCYREEEDIPCVVFKIYLKFWQIPGIM